MSIGEQKIVFSKRNFSKMIIAKSLYCFIKYGEIKTMKLVMDFYNSSFFNSETRNAEFKNKNSGYPFVAFLVYGINPDKLMSNSLTDFVKFWESFSRTLSNFSVWNKSEKKLGEFINEVLKYLFSDKNIISFWYFLFLFFSVTYLC